MKRYLLISLLLFLSAASVVFVPGKSFCMNAQQGECFCMNEDNRNRPTITLPCCTAICHKHCIDTWYSSRPNCPFCRRALRKIGRGYEVATGSQATVNRDYRREQILEDGVMARRLQRLQQNMTPIGTVPVLLRRQARSRERRRVEETNNFMENISRQIENNRRDHQQWAENPGRSETSSSNTSPTDAVATLARIFIFTSTVCVTKLVLGKLLLFSPLSPTVTTILAINLAWRLSRNKMVIHATKSGMQFSKKQISKGIKKLIVS